jgi:hypothetical protein
MRKPSNISFEVEKAPPADDTNMMTAEMAMVDLLPVKASLSQSENQQELRTLVSWNVD